MDAIVNVGGDGKVTNVLVNGILMDPLDYMHAGLQLIGSCSKQVTERVMTTLYKDDVMYAKFLAILTAEKFHDDNQWTMDDNNDDIRQNNWDREVTALLSRFGIRLQ